LNESISNVLFNKTEETLLNEEIDIILEQYLSEEHITEQVETYLDQFSEEEIQLICEAYENNDEEIIDALHEGFLGERSFLTWR
jgi:NACalpha-BTF3-like transcription factor